MRFPIFSFDFFFLLVFKNSLYIGKLSYLTLVIPLNFCLSVFKSIKWKITSKLVQLRVDGDQIR